jgi:hypothetical protein
MVFLLLERKLRTLNPVEPFWVFVLEELIALGHIEHKFFVGFLCEPIILFTGIASNQA